MSLNTSVIKYKPSFKLEEVKTTKMKTVNNLGRGDGYETCAKFEKGGIELLLYVSDDFNLTMEALKLTSSSDMAEFWKKILGHGPSEKGKKMLPTGNDCDDNVERNSGVSPDNAEDAIEIETAIPGSGFKRSI